MSTIFISYRREDAAGYAISLNGLLAGRFGTLEAEQRLQSRDQAAERLLSCKATINFSLAARKFSNISKSPSMENSPAKSNAAHVFDELFPP
jgi:hypothetical protein